MQYYQADDFGLFRGKAICLIGAAAAFALTLATLILVNWVPGTGLGLKFEHFSACFVMAAVLCVVSRRPYLAALALGIFLAALSTTQSHPSGGKLPESEHANGTLFATATG